MDGKLELRILLNKRIANLFKGSIHFMGESAQNLSRDYVCYVSLFLLDTMISCDIMRILQERSWNGTSVCQLIV